jgi:tRNA pseudouridine55 synthase
MQVPPMYSALKHRGEPLHRIARRGIQVERKPRQVKVFRLEMTAWRTNEITLEIACSSGTYVRSLVHELGQALGCGACLTALTRLASGSFQIEDSTTLRDLGLVATDGRWLDILHPIDVALTQFPPVYLSAGAARRVCSGQGVSLLTEGVTLPGKSRLHSFGGRTHKLARAYGPAGAFLALVTFDSNARTLRPHKVFCVPEL